MADIIQQLLDLKEWSQNPERYERRLNFRGAGLVQPGPEGVRHGYQGEPWLTKQKQQAKNIKNQKATWDKIGDAMWKANETGDFEYLMNNEKLQKDIKKHDPTRKKTIKYKKGMIDGSMRQVISGSKKHGKQVLPLAQNETGLRYIASQYNMDVDRVLDILEESKDFSSQSRQLTWREQILAKSSKTKSQFATGEKWMLNNAKRFDDPAKFKAAYIKRFGRGNAFIKAITNNTKAYFSSKFNFDLMGAKGLSDEGSKMTMKLGDNIFSSVIYNMNPQVRKSITNEFERALTGDVPTVKYQARKTLSQSPLLKKFGLDKRIYGPISRLIFKEIGDKMYKNIQAFRNPRMSTLDFLNYLEDVVDPKYKSQFVEARKAVDYARRNKWKDAKKVLNIADNINWDHKIPSFLIEAGYADELEYIKLQPTTEHFNIKIKNKQFDIPMAKIIREYENAPASQKANVIEKMQNKIDDFSRQHGGYMKGVKVTPDKTGKPIFTSQAGPLTKKTDVVKSLKTSLAQEKGKLPAVKKISKPGGGVMLGSGPMQFLDDLAKSKVASRIGRFAVSDWVWPEVAAAYAIYKNYKQKGLDHKRALNETLKEATFGFYDRGETENQVLSQAKKLGADSDQLKNLETFMKMKKLQEQMRSEHKKFETASLNAEALPEGVEPRPGVVLNYGAEAKASEKRLNEMATEYVDLEKAYKGGDTSPQLADQAMTELMRTEWNQSLSGRQKRVDPYAGEIGSWLGKEVFTISPQERQAMQEKIDIMNPQELRDFNLERGIGKEQYHPLYGAGMSYKQMEPMYDSMGYLFKAGGGIANVRRPWAIPPVSGPVPQGGGLSSQFNRVKKLME